MLQKIIAFFMAIISFFAGLFGGVSTKSFIFNNVSYGTEQRQKLDLYIPKKAENGRVGLVLNIHGGAWIGGDKSSYTKQNMKYTSDDLGYAAATINYRYISETVDLNDLMDDVEAALAKIKALGAEKNVTIDKVLLMGYSAGAHMSLLYAYSRAETAPIKPVAVVSYCGPTDLNDKAFYVNNAMGDANFMAQLFSYAGGQSFAAGAEDEAYDALAKVSPINYVSEKTVPTVMAHGQKDNTVPFSNAAALDAKLTQFGVKHDFVVYPNSDHDLANDPDCAKKANDLLMAYAAEYLAA